MAVYAIGDVQGCFDELQALLDRIGFDPAEDRLWFAGDLVNRGPKSLETLRFIRGLGEGAVSVLGNHDLHLLAAFYHHRKTGRKDTLDELLRSSHSESLLEWLRRQPLIHTDTELDVSMVHAGLHPEWTLQKARELAGEVEEMLRGADGAMTGFAYPEMMAQVIAAHNAGDIDHGRDIFDAYMPMVRYEAQPGLGLAIRKYTLAQRGIIAHDTVRKPGGVLSAATKAEVDALAERQAKKLEQLGL